MKRKAEKINIEKQDNKKRNQEFDNDSNASSFSLHDSSDGSLDFNDSNCFADAEEEEESMAHLVGNNNYILVEFKSNSGRKRDHEIL